MLTVVIQAGGDSSRMGRDKALLPFLGEPLIARVYHRVKSIADEILITTNRPESFQFLGLRLVPDLIAGRGALGGLYTALSHATNEYVAVVACDMPFVNPMILKAGRDKLVNEVIDAVIPQTDRGYEPLHAVYRRSTCLIAVRAVIESCEWRLISWLPKVVVATFTKDEVKQCDPSGLAFWNVNTTAEFNQAEVIARQMTA